MGTLVEKRQAIEDARKLLKDAGYYTGNLWSVSDVKMRSDCTDAEAQEVLEKAMTSDYTMGMIWDAIDAAAEEYVLKNRKGWI